MKEFNKSQRNKNPNIISENPPRNRNILRKIAAYIDDRKQPFSWKDIKEHLIEEHKISIRNRDIWKILHENFNYSYKRCSSRPLFLDHELVSIKKILFSIKLLKVINKSTILINVDESTFSYNIKPNYSWSKRGWPANLSNAIMKGSVSVISRILSNGLSISWVGKQNINSELFIEFIVHMLGIWKKL